MLCRDKFYDKDQLNCHASRRSMPMLKTCNGTAQFLVYLVLLPNTVPGNKDVSSERTVITKDVNLRQP
jgi:hypothetical protein